MSSPAPPRSAPGVNPTRKQLDELDALIRHMLALPAHESQESAPSRPAEPPAPASYSIPGAVRPHTPESAPAAIMMSALASVTVDPAPAAQATQSFVFSPADITPTSSSAPQVHSHGSGLPERIETALTSQATPEPRSVPSAAVAEAPMVVPPIEPVAASVKQAPAPIVPPELADVAARNGLAPDVSDPAASGTPVQSQPQHQWPKAGLARAAHTTGASHAVAPALPVEPSPSDSTNLDEGGLSAWLLWPLVMANRAFDCCTLPLGGTGEWLRANRGRTLLGWTGLGLLAAAAAWGVLDWIGWTR